jgi:hypothetical protein
LINITKNKRLFARQIRKQTEQLELKMYRKLTPIFRKIFREVSVLIKHGDPLNIVPTVVKRHSKEMQEVFLNHYKTIGAVNYKGIINRLTEISKTKNIGYQRKDSQSSFWWSFNNWAKGQAVAKVLRIDDTTKNILRVIIDKSIKEGRSYSEIAKILQDVEGISSKNRAMMIAVTETHTVFNKSIFESIESTNVKMETKEWLNAGDERVRQGIFDHVKANGETVGMDEYFQDTGEPLLYPGDPSGDPGNIIYCRCVTLYNTEVTEIGN